MSPFESASQQALPKRFSRWPLCLALILLGCSPGTGAAAPAELSGTWSLRIAGGDMFVLRLQCAARCKGQFERPQGLSIEYTLFQVSDPAQRVDVIKSSVRSGEGWRLKLASPRGDERDFVVVPRGAAVLFGLADEPPGSGLGPWLLEPRPEAQLSLAWAPNRAYVVGDHATSDDEMAAIHAEDRSDRMKPGARPSDWTTRDRRRKARTIALLQAGRLTTGEDLERAAFVFQHGEGPDDYLRAHALAMAATSKGRAGAVWLAAASLDRYFRAVGQPQIFGTQFAPDPNDANSRVPCRADAVLDLLRPQLGLPPAAARACSARETRSDDARP